MAGTWTSLITWAADTALSVTRLNAFIGSNGNMQWLKDMLYAKDGGELTISSGSIASTGNSAYYTVDTESDASSDDLDTISGGTDGDVIMISPESGSRTVVIKDGTGNVNTGDYGNIYLTETDHYVVLRYDGSNWVVLATNAPPSHVIQISVIDHDRTLETGDDQHEWMVPDVLDGYEFVSMHCGVFNPSTSGLPTFQFYNQRHAADILSTRVSIDANEYHSYTAATQPVINSSYKGVQKGDRIRFDCDVAGTGTEGWIWIAEFVKAS